MIPTLPESGWSVEDLLADGAAGPVWRCVAPDGTRGVLKMAAPGASEVARARVRREAELLARLPAHPALPRLLDHGVHDGLPWLVLAEVPGRDLRTLWTAPPVSWAVAVHALRPVADALAHLHAHGIAHRDVKPANLLVHEGRAVLIDLGAASDPQAQSALTLGAAPATPRWAAPESLAGNDEAALPGDVYSLGQVLHELLIGGPAFPSEAASKLQDPVLDPGPRAPGPLRELVRAMTDPDPGARPTAAEALRILVSLDVGAVTVPTPTLGGADPQAPGRLPDRLGRYVLREEIGRGGMGRVLRAHDPELDREVAIKVLSHRDGGLPERFRREARALARLNHPGFVGVLDIGREDDVDYFVMELMEGPDLARLLEREGRLDPSRARTWFADVAEALHAAHARGLVHRDIKPSNLLLDEEERLRVVDLGIVGGGGVLASLDPDDARTTPGLGTPRYMAPEQATDAPVTAAADVYALAVVLHEALTGALPWDPPELPVALRKPALHPSLPDPVRDLLSRALDLDPDRRPSAAAFAEALRPTLEPAEASIPADRRRTLVLAGALTVALAALGLAMVAPWRPAPTEDPREQAAMATWERARGDIEAHLAAGNRDEALAVLTSFTGFPAHQGTRAQTLAWWFAGREALTPAPTGFRQDPAFDAFSRAFVQARELEDQRGILQDLAVRRHASHDLAPMVDALAARSDPSDPVLARWRRAVDHAYRTERVPAPSPLDALRRGTPLPDLDVWGFVVVDVDQDGRDDLVSRGPSGWAWYPGGDPRGRPKPLEIEGDVSLGYPTWYGEIPGRGAHAMMTDPAGKPVFDNRLVHIHPGGVRPVTEPWRLAQYDHAATARIGGEVRFFAGATTWDRVLHEIDLESWELRDAHPQTSSANAEMRHLLAVDLDEDEDDELLVATGPWGGWDLRVLDGDEDGILHLRSRTVLGSVNGIHRLRTPRGPRFLVPTLIEGLPEAWETEGRRGPALRLLHYTGQAFVEEDRIPLDNGARFAMMVADLDGDGIDEAMTHRMQVFWFDGDTPLMDRVGGLAPMAVLDVDGDGDDEVLAREAGGTVWMLGLGDEPLPPLDQPESRAEAPPDTVDGELRAAWERAETLAEIGHGALAAERLVELARLLSGSAADRARLRAAELFVEALQYDKAERTLLAVAQRWQTPTPEVIEAVEHLVDRLEQDLSLEAADTWARRRLTLAERAGDAEGVRRWKGRADAVATLSALPTYEVDPRRTLQEQGWEVVRPLAVESGPNGLTVRSARHGLLAQRLVRLHGRALVMDVAWDVRRAEWSTEIGVSLYPVDPEHPGGLLAALFSDGGRGSLKITFRCSVGGRTSFYGGITERPPPMVGEIVTGRYAIGPDHRGRCEPAWGPVDAARLPRDASYVLAITDVHAPRAPAAVEMTLVELRLHGASPLPLPDPDGPSPFRETGALPLENALARARLRGGMPALTPPGVDPLIPDIIRFGRAQERDALRAALGPERWQHALLETWTLPATMHLGPVADALARDLADLPGLPSTPENTRVQAELLLMRVAAALHLGRTAGSHDDLDRVETLLARLPEEDHALRSRSRRLRTVLLTREGLLDQALDTLLDGIAGSPSPQTAAEGALADERLAPLHDLDRWPLVRAWRHRTWDDVQHTRTPR